MFFKTDAGFKPWEGASLFVIFTQTIIHLVYLTPKKILHNHCFQFFLGITVVPREIKTDLGGGLGGGVKQGALWSM